jgi:hypothetical protein
MGPTMVVVMSPLVLIKLPKLASWHPRWHHHAVGIQKQQQQQQATINISNVINNYHNYINSPMLSLSWIIIHIIIIHRN